MCTNLRFIQPWVFVLFVSQQGRSDYQNSYYKREFEEQSRNNLLIDFTFYGWLKIDGWEKFVLHCVSLKWKEIQVGYNTM